MMYSGFYMIEGEDFKNIEKEVREVYDNEIKETLKKLFKRESLTITDIIRTPEYDQKRKSKSYDVHFLLGLPLVNIEEDTKAFYDLEQILCTGLRTIEKDELLDNAI